MGKSISNRRSWRRRLTVMGWLAIPLLLMPLTYNCHGRTDQSAAARSLAGQADSDDQTVHTMEPTTEDGAPQSAGKVRLGDVAVSGAQAKQSGMSAQSIGKLQAQDDALVPAGTEIVALYDNACRSQSQAQGAGLRFEAEAKRIEQDSSLQALVAEAESDPCLLRIDENIPMKAFATVNDPRVAEAKHVSQVNALSSWDWFYSGAGITQDTLVAVVDSGVAYTHPDLVDNMYLDANGRRGYDFQNNDNDPMDDNGHGTHVAGIIAARADNGVGVTGVGGNRIKILAVKVIDATGGGDTSAVVNGIRYAADQGAKVINLSLGGQGTSTALRDAMSYAVGKGAVVVAAAGNDGVLINTGTNFYSPSGYAKDIPGAIAVGAIDATNGGTATITRSNGTTFAFSNYGTTYVWIAAPGSNGVLSTYLGNGYFAQAGTSMAAPVVSGAAAAAVGVLRSRNVSYSPSDIVSLLTDSARTNSALTGQFRNGAVLDMERLGKLVFSRYIMTGNAGTEEP